MFVHICMYIYICKYIYIVFKRNSCSCQKSHMKRHELLFSRTVSLNYPASARLNHSKHGKRRVRGVSNAISPFLGEWEEVENREDEG